MRLIVTGGLGYIGSRLVPELVRRFHSPVVIFDNLSFLEDAEPSARAEFSPVGEVIQGDILDFDFKNFLKIGDIVIHLAAVADPAKSLEDPAAALKINCAGTARVAEACAAAGVPLLFPSTTSVYQEDASESLPLESLVPQTSYAASKLAAEKEIFRLQKNTGLHAVTLRFATVFGLSPHLRFHPAVNKFCLQAVRKTPLSVWETALRQFRPYLFIGDAVESICFLIERARFTNEVFNVVTLNATVETVLGEIRDFVPDLQIVPRTDPRMNCLSYRAEAPGLKKIGFQFSGSLKSAVEETIEFLKLQLSSEAAGIPALK